MCQNHRCKTFQADWKVNRMREILFKAKRIDNGEWVEGYYAIAIDKRGIRQHNILVADHSLGYFKWYVIDENTLCQYTGLTDKNGKKIWENDVVIYDNSPYNVYCTPHKGQIVCRNGSLCFKYFWYGVNYQSLFSDIFFETKCEVIGNIFDNPELLGGADNG